MPEKMKVQKADCTIGVAKVNKNISAKIDPGQTGGVRPIGVDVKPKDTIKVPKNNINGGMTALKNKASVKMGR